MSVMPACTDTSSDDVVRRQITSFGFDANAHGQRSQRAAATGELVREASAKVAGSALSTVRQ